MTTSSADTRWPVLKTGFENATDMLIENAYYILTPGGQIDIPRLTQFMELISSLGAIPLVLTYEEHDYITAAVSHLPHIIASTLVNAVQKWIHQRKI